MVDTHRPEMPPPRGGVTGRGGQATKKRGITLADQVEDACNKLASAVGGELLSQVGMKHRSEFKLTKDGMRFTLEATRGKWPELPPPFDDDGD